MSDGLVTADTRECGVVILGGGATGLWLRGALAATGRSTCLVETAALGGAQTLQSQGIVHGGGKYALRSVKDFGAVSAIRAMPDRWREHLAGERTPSLARARVLSSRCLLWDRPAAGVLGRVRQLILPVVARSGVLHARPLPLPREDWPEALEGTANSVYAMAEPVLDTRSVVEALCTASGDPLLAAQPGSIRLELEDSRWRVSLLDADGRRRVTLVAPAVVLAAGAGNAELLAAAGLDGERAMQRRPLAMFLLRGRLPELHGHWVSGGRTRMTITSSAPLDPDGRRVWVIGGQVAEDAVGADPAAAIARGRAELTEAFPQLAGEGGLEIATYAAVRAEARNDAARRPSGVHHAELAPGLFVAWPTKLALVPLLVDELVAELVDRAPAGAASSSLDWPEPAVGSMPWEDAHWEPLG